MVVGQSIAARIRTSSNPLPPGPSIASKAKGDAAAVASSDPPPSKAKGDTAAEKELAKRQHPAVIATLAVITKIVLGLQWHDKYSRPLALDPADQDDRYARTKRFCQLVAPLLTRILHREVKGKDVEDWARTRRHCWDHPLLDSMSLQIWRICRRQLGSPKYVRQVICAAMLGYLPSTAKGVWSKAGVSGGCL